MNGNHEYNYITLDELRRKYIKMDDKSFIYMVDDKFLLLDQSDYYIDEKDIYSIEVYKSKDFSYLKNNNSEFTIINILVTKDRNNRIMIR